MTPRRGRRSGISHYLVDSGEGLAKALELAGKIAQQRANHQFRRHARPAPHRGSKPAARASCMEALMAAVAQGSEEAKERLRAFLEKRAEKVDGVLAPGSYGTRCQRRSVM